MNEGVSLKGRVSEGWLCRVCYACSEPEKLCVDLRSCQLCSSIKCGIKSRLRRNAAHLEKSRGVQIPQPYQIEEQLFIVCLLQGCIQVDSLSFMALGPRDEQPAARKGKTRDNQRRLLKIDQMRKSRQKMPISSRRTNQSSKCNITTKS